MTDQPAPQPPAIVYESEHDIADSLMDRARMGPAHAYEVASGLAADLGRVMPVHAKREETA